MSKNDCFFASANSKDGFAGFFDEVFKNCNYRYIIKGGPGTGKSTLMRKLGERAEALGHETEYILCSSDPTSLDGIIINDMGVAVLDGTAPHMCDPTLPGINSEIINLGTYWNAKKLAPYAEKVKSLSDSQSSLYKKAYDYIGAIYKTRMIVKSYTKNAIDTEKAQSFAERFARKFRPVTLGDETVRLYDSIGMKGYRCADGFHAKENYVIKPFYMAEYEIISLIRQSLKKRHVKMTVSYSHMDAKTVNAILLPEHDVSVVISDNADENDMRINTERFIDRTKLNEVKNKLRFAEKCEKELMCAALDTFDEINTVHFDIENIYKGAMSFTKLTKDSEKIIDKILGV